jgi:hypothetical protein
VIGNPAVDDHQDLIPHVQVRLPSGHDIRVHLNVKLCDGVVVFITLARNENRAELEEDTNSLGSSFLISRIGCPRGSLQAQSLVSLRGKFLAFAEERNLEKLTQLFQSPGNGGTRESCVATRVVKRRSRWNGPAVRGREVLWIQRSCIETQSVPVIFSHSNL